MLKWFLKIMGLKANNKVVRNKKVASPKGEATPTAKPSLELTQFETEILLNAMKNATFSGDMIMDLHTLVTKLQKHHQKFK